MEVKAGLDAVRRWVEGKILAMIEKCQWDLCHTESPSEDDIMGWAGNYPMEVW
jgi:hypothetical protein